MEKVNVVLTDELKKKLSGSLGFNVSAEFPYVLKVFRENNIPKDLWPVFTLTSKDGVEICELEDSIGEVIYDDVHKKRSMKINSGSQRLETLEKGIVKVKNYIMEDGTIISFDREKGEISIGGLTKNGCTVRDFVKYLPPAIQIELQNVINEHKVLTPEELTGLE